MNTDPAKPMNISNKHTPKSFNFLIKYLFTLNSCKTKYANNEKKTNNSTVTS